MADRSSLGRRIRQLRQERGISGKEIAEKMGYSAAAISKIERGLLRPTNQFVSEYVNKLQLSKSERHALLELEGLFNSQFEGWAENVEQDSNHQKIISLREKNSSILRVFMNHVVPGLLQTESYMRAVFGCIPSIPLKSYEKLVTLRKKRQALLKNDGRIAIFVLSEAALRSCVGSVETQIEQLHYLAMVSEVSPTIELRILPFSRVLTQFPLHSFSIYDSRLVEIEVNRGQLDLWTEADIEYYLSMMNNLVLSSLSPIKSRDFILKIRSEIS